MLHTNKGLHYYFSMNTDEKWMLEALKEALQAANEDEIPIGAVVVHNGRIIGKGHNLTQRLNDATAHAEMLAITAAQNTMGKYLTDCTLYVTIEPCVMCAGALAWSQIKRIVYGASDEKKGHTTFLAPARRLFRPSTEIVSGILADECSRLMIDFFQCKRR